MQNKRLHGLSLKSTGNGLQRLRRLAHPIIKGGAGDTHAQALESIHLAMKR